jgi:hypothetical protein
LRRAGLKRTFNCRLEKRRGAFRIKLEVEYWTMHPLGYSVSLVIPSLLPKSNQPPSKLADEIGRACTKIYGAIRCGQSSVVPVSALSRSLVLLVNSTGGFGSRPAIFSPRSTEGFDALDLKEAKALLDELAS